MKSQTLLTPIALSDGVKVGRRRWWKQILPVTKIDYKGQKVNFDPRFHLDLADAFHKGAFDQVPLVFADSQNGHNMDPRNFGGDIIDMEYRGDAPDQGTWALIEADKQAARVIKRNPKLGVSARIRQAIDKADGRHFKRGIEHVLLTMNPRVTGMSPWQAVDLSEDDGIEVVDLTAAEYQEGTTMGKTPTKGRRQQSQIDLSALDDEEFNSLLIDLTTEVAERGIDVDDLEDNLDDDAEDETPAPNKRRWFKSKVTKTVDRSEDVDDEDDDGEDIGDADLSDRVDTMSTQFSQFRVDRASEAWKTKRRQYLSNGVPPVLLDLAEPVLSQPDEMVIDLADSDGEETQIDFRQTLTEMLDGVQHIVDLSGELGSAQDLDLSDEETSQADALAAEWAKHYSA